MKILKLMLLMLLAAICLTACGSGSSNNPPAADPLFNQQWHLVNTGQAAFSAAGGVAGEDHRMTQTVAASLSGSGVIVAVLDSGLEIAHEDLQSNVIPNGSWNFVNLTTDPTPTGTGGDHGTSVTGIIAAAGYNGLGGRGVAYAASLKGFNVLQSQSDQNYVESMGGHARSQNVDIFNMSYGSDTTTFNALTETARELYTSTAELRGGKGGIYVKSAGNGFVFIQISDSEYHQCTDQAYGLATLSCQNATAEEECSRPEVITVGAFNASGVKASYSTAGANLWVSAPGGEYGSVSPAIITTDQSGCDKGYSRSNHPSPVNSFETGDATYNPACNYTSAFNGTSAAAPNASGAIALMLQAKSSLTRRDIKHILAQTARKIDPDVSAVNVSIDDENYVARQGWITNQAGYHFHNWYGFGAIHVDNAVAMAKTYSTVLPALQDKSYGGALSPAVAIPDNNAAGVTQTIEIADGDNLTIENFFLIIALDHPDAGETGIEVMSPQGTRSILLNIRSGLRTGLNVTIELLIRTCFSMSAV